MTDTQYLYNAQEMNLSKQSNATQRTYTRHGEYNACIAYRRSIKLITINLPVLIGCSTHYVLLATTLVPISIEGAFALADSSMLPNWPLISHPSLTMIFRAYIGTMGLFGSLSNLPHFV
jgi:hypothetical protein